MQNLDFSDFFSFVCSVWLVWFYYTTAGRKVNMSKVLICTYLRIYIRKYYIFMITLEM